MRKGLASIGIEFAAMLSCVAGTWFLMSGTNSQGNCLRGLSNALRVYTTLQTCTSYYFPPSGQQGDPCFGCDANPQPAGNGQASSGGTWAYGTKFVGKPCGNKVKGKIGQVVVDGQVIVTCTNTAPTGDKCADLPVPEAQTKPLPSLE